MTTQYPGPLSEATEYTPAQLDAMLAYCLSEPYPMSDNLRTAVWEMPKAMSCAEWVAVCARKGINAGTARNRRREALNDAKELDALASQPDEVAK